MFHRLLQFTIEEKCIERKTNWLTELAGRHGLRAIVGLCCISHNFLVLTVGLRGRQLILFFKISTACCRQPCVAFECTPFVLVRQGDTYVQADDGWKTQLADERSRIHAFPIFTESNVCVHCVYCRIICLFVQRGYVAVVVVAAQDSRCFWIFFLLVHIYSTWTLLIHFF